jgi:hypothetical protein
MPSIRPRLDARPDRLDLRDLPYRPPLRSLPPRWPADVDLARFLPSYVKAGLVLNQGNEGACTGFGLACVTNYLLWLRALELARASKSKEPPKLERVSPRMFYELARLYDEWPGQDYDGSSCRGALKGWHKHGVCGFDFWPYPVDPKTNAGLFVRPQPGWEVDAAKRPLGVYYRIDKASVVDIQSAIHEIGAVYVSGTVHDGWDDLVEFGTKRRPPLRSHDGLPLIGKLKDPKQNGGHSFALVGYNERGFVVQNSWGPSWGAGGFAVLRYEDWVTNATDAWAVALGVAQSIELLQDQQKAPAGKSRRAAPAAAGFRVAAGRGLSSVGPTLRQAQNPQDDPWPFDHPFAFKAYQPIGTADAYGLTLVSGNDGKLMMTDFTRERGDLAALAREIVVERPLAWLKAGAPPATPPAKPAKPTKGAQAAKAARTLKLVLYAHGGLNAEGESLQRIRVLAPYFLANGIYPVFFTWKTGAAETIGDMLGDLKGRIFGTAGARAEGWLDQLREATAEARDRGVEAVARQFARGIWSEMRENAECGTAPGHTLALAAAMLRELRAKLQADGRTLELHLIGHSAGSILLGHLLDLLADPAAGVVPVAGCELYAAACSSAFALQHYGAADRAGVLKLDRLHLHVLADAVERDDGLPDAAHPIYGKSLLYLVSRSLDDVRKQPLLGMERALVPPAPQWVDDQWVIPAGMKSNPQVADWLAAWPAGALLHVVTTPKVRNTKVGGQTPASHGSFDNNIDVLTGTLERLRGGPLVSPMEWLDY